MIMKKLLIVLFAFMLFSCATGKDAWVKDPYSMYPQSDYVCAVGYGHNPEEAAINAKRELASLFGMSIEAVTKRSLSEEYRDNGIGISETYSELFSSDTQTTVFVDNLFGVRIAEEIEKDGKFIALAVMEKAPTIAQYRKELPFMKNALVENESSIAANSGSFYSIGMANDYYKNVEQYNAHVGIYNYLSGADYEYYDLSKAQKVVIDASSLVSLSVDVEGDESGAVNAALSEVFTDNGFRVLDCGSNPTSVASVKIAWSEFKGIGNPFTFANYNVKVSIYDTDSGKSVFVYDFEGKEGHQTFDGAKTRAIRNITEIIENEFKEKLFSTYIGG